jgi:dihydroorotate dehydrogenase (fumarate)
MNLSTSYLGLQLRNPIVIGASPLTLDAESIVKCDQAGAGAVVIKSLFEEQINEDTATLSNMLMSQENMHAEVYEYLEASIGMRYGTRNYLDIVKRAKDQVEIPVIASINCIESEWWKDFAQEVVAAGADALELNIAIQAKNPLGMGDEIERQYLDVVGVAREAIDKPIAVKIGPHFSNIPSMVARLSGAGADACVLFNRFWCPDIDIEDEAVVLGETESAHSEMAMTLRWIAMLSGRVRCQLAAATGIHTGEDVIRMLLAGADVAQVVTAPLTEGRECISEMLDTVGIWMERKGYTGIDDFKGKVSQARQPESQELFTRTQYMDAMGTRWG